ncbi:MAG: SIR2 family protein, partial [Nocardioides sp.]
MTENYFQKRSTYQTISDLATPMDWTIYVGLGATADRTGTSWESLVLGLFRQLKIGNTDAQNWIKKQSLLGASTTLEAICSARYDDPEGYTASLREGIRRELYGPRIALKGRLLQNLAEFGYTNARRGKNVVFVTTNYDNYLDEALGELDYGGRSQPKLFNNISIDAANKALPQNWRKPRTVHCIHVHGIVDPIDTSEHNAGVPVLGELQYSESSKRTEAALATLFRNRNILIVGSNIADGPLVSALIRSKPRVSAKAKPEPRRIVIQAMQGDEWDVPEPELNGILELNRRRLEALGLQNTRPHHFSQTSQLISEITTSIVAKNQPHMLHETYQGRYDNRLDAWWRQWSSECKQRPDVQAQHHEWLQVAC